MFSRSYGIIYTSLVIIYPPRIFNFVFRELFLPTFNVLLFYDELASLVGSNCFRHVSNCSRWIRKDAYRSRNRKVGGLSTNLTGGFSDPGETSRTELLPAWLAELRGIITVHGRVSGSMTKVGPNPKNVASTAGTKKRRVVRFTFVNRVAANDSRSTYLHRFNLSHGRIVNFPCWKLHICVCCTFSSLKMFEKWQFRPESELWDWLSKFYVRTIGRRLPIYPRGQIFISVRRSEYCFTVRCR